MKMVIESYSIISDYPISHHLVCQPSSYVAGNFCSISVQNMSFLLTRLNGDTH